LPAAKPAAPGRLILRIRLRSPAPCPLPGDATAAATGTMRHRTGGNRYNFTSCRFRSAWAGPGPGQLGSTW